MRILDWIRSGPPLHAWGALALAGSATASNGAATLPPPSSVPGVEGALLLLVSVAGLGVFAFARRVQVRRAHGSALEHVERLWLGRGVAVHLVRVEGSRVLLGSGPSGVRLLREVPDRLESEQ